MIDVASRLRAVLPPGRVLDDPADLDRVARDESDLPPGRPACVVRPASTAEVVRVVETAIGHRVPITARGGGSSLEGSSIPSAGAVVIDFAAMDAILEVRPGERSVVVQPGVVYDRLNDALRPTGLRFPPSPGGSGDVATIGGMVATDAAGIHALRYGGTRPWVATLEVVTGRAEVLRAGSRAPRSSAGYALKDLFVGSEGTLGLVTEVTLRLAPVPEATRQAAAAFDDLEAACRAAADLAAYLPALAAVELVDASTLDVLRALPGHGDAPAGHVLFLETHGRAAECDDALALALSTVRGHGGRPVEPGASDPWALRHRTTRALRALAGPAGVARTDGAVPLPRLAAYVADARDRAASLGRRTYAFGHVGLGIVHCLMPLGGPGAWPRDEALAEKARLSRLAVSMGGTVTGEHGVGLGQREALAVEHPLGVAYMRRLKEVFDPAGILNPGKVI